jgi:hypothetical protein
MDILDQYIESAPSIQNVLNIFEDEWASKLPEGLSSLKAGQTPLFEDARIHWAVEKLGGIRGKHVLELGPLEAGHTYILEKMGAASITAIESNTRAYLKCLIIKEILDLKQAHFLCGDFIEYLRKEQGKFDACVASGVLYHTRNPAELISLISQVSTQAFIWTHYYDPDIIQSNPILARKFPSSLSAEYNGFRHTLYRQEYQDALNFTGFCGGSKSFSHWMRRDDILSCLKFFGFNEIEIDTSYDAPNHPNGPSFGLVAKRK